MCVCVRVCRVCTFNDKLHMKKGKMPGQHIIISMVIRPCGLAVRFRKNRSGSDQFCRVDGTRAATRVDGKDSSYYHTFEKNVLAAYRMRLRKPG